MEHDDADDEGYYGEACAVGEGAVAEMAGAEEAVFEAFDDGAKGVELDEGFELAFGYGAHGVDDGGGVHEELYAEGDEEFKVAVFGGHAGEQDAEAHAHHGHYDDVEGDEGEGPVGLYDAWFAYEVVGVNDEEEGELDEEFDEAADYFAEGHDESGKIDFAEDGGVLGEGVAGLVEAFGEVVPDDDAAEVEEGHGGAVGAYLGDVAEDYDVDEGGEDGLYDKPDGAEDGLFVHGDDVALDEHAEQVAVLPDFFEVDVEGMALGAYDEVEVVHELHELFIARIGPRITRIARIARIVEGVGCVWVTVWWC